MINTNAPIATYTGNNTTDTFSFTFKARQDDDILIVKFNTTDNTIVWSERGNVGVNVSSCTVDSLNGGGTVVLAAGNLEVNRKLMILLSPVDPVQTDRFREQGDFRLRSVEQGLDYCVAYIQALREEMNRTLRLGPISNFNTDIETMINELPPADGILQFDENGEVVGWITPDEIVSSTGGFVDTDYAYDGYSARFSEAFLSTDLDDTLQKILDLSYLAPLITLSGTGSGTIREKGASLASAPLTAAITKRSDPIAEVRFYRGVTLIDTQTSGGAIPSGGNSTYTDNTGWTDTISFSAQVDDDGTTGGPTTVTSNTVTYTFVYPYYYGAGAAGLTAAQVAALTKSVIVSTATVNQTITAGAGEVFYFAYPASYGALTSILDVNGFNTLPDWTLRTENITGLDGNPVSYRIYEFNNPVTAGDYYYSFRR